MQVVGNDESSVGQSQEHYGTARNEIVFFRDSLPLREEPVEEHNTTMWKCSFFC